MSRLGLEVRNMPIKKIFVSSPLRGDIEKNIENAKKYCKKVLEDTGDIPIAPHVYFTQFLNADNEFENQLGMDLGLELLSDCDEIWVFQDNGISEGMKMEIELAKRLEIPIIFTKFGE